MTEPLVPIAAPAVDLAQQLQASASLSLAALQQLPDLPHDGVQIVGHVDLRSGSAAIGGVIEIRDWRGGVIATRSAQGHWGIGGQVVWAFGK